MTDRETRIVISELSRRVSLEGKTVDVQIYRFEDEEDWVLVVANESGSSAVWDEVYPTDIAAMAAFHIIVEEQGLSAFLNQGGFGTVH